VPEVRESILIVDDNPANLRLLSHLLTGHGYNVRAVTGGERALASAELHPPDLVLLDIRMPEIDGFEVCRRLKGNAKTLAAPVLFISALDDIGDKVSAFAAGGVDYITKPFQMEEVLARVETHLALRRLQRSLEEANRRMEQELALAARVQASFMARGLPALPGYELAVRLIPALQTSGDFYDVVKLIDGRVALIIADVVDKGVGAALYMAMSCALLRSSLFDHGGAPEAVFKAVNERLLAYATADQFVTVFLGVLEPESGTLIYANAGHNPPIWLRRNEAPRWLASTGPPLAIVETMAWEQQRLELLPGDVLVLYTDGVTESENQREGFYGQDRLLRVTSDAYGLSAEALRDTILHGVETFTDDSHPADDVALMVLIRA
jgi:phosphoserine phosphatase RsbU/P